MFARIDNNFDISVAKSTINQRKDDTEDKRTTVLVMQMGQFIDHDFAHSPNFQDNPRDCCNGLDSFPNSFDTERCFPIPIPANDPYFKSIGRRCMDFHRAMPSPDLNCDLGKREQVNESMNCCT